MDPFLDGAPGRYWHKLEDGRIQCDLCPRYCRLHDGQRGLCYVRARHDDSMVLTTYGRSSGFCIDPIEKKPLNHFLPGTPVLSFGTAGCNLTCKFCQNWDISKARDFDRLQNQASPEAIAQAAVASGSRSVAFTYNDPVIFLEYAVDVAQACRERGVKTVAVSAGYICPEPRVELFRHMDAANIDLKGFTESFYKNLCSARLGPVLETLEYLKHETDVWFEITTLLIPGENDSPADAARDAAPGPAHRLRDRAALRVHRQYSRSRGPGHLLPWLPRAADRPGLVRSDRVESRQRRPLRPLRRCMRRRVPGQARKLGPAAANDQSARN